ncbi:MAG: selenide, water dikinase SelD [Pseudomonadota bacterium]
MEKVRLTSLAHGGGCGCKIAPGVLEDLLAAAGASAFVPSSDLLVDAATRDDAAVYRVGDDVAVVATTDFFMPIVDDAYDFGRIAATNALSDVFAMGATPVFCLAILGMPIDKLSPETIGAIVRGGRDAAEAVGAPVAGGHSIDAAEPIYGLVAIGTAHPDRLLTNANAQEGDVLILSKPIGIGIYSAAYKREALDEAGYDEMIRWTTLANRPGPKLTDLDGVHAVTDVTGFGLLGHAAEMARGADRRLEIDYASLPILSQAVSLLRDGFKTGASGRNWNSLEEMVDLPASLPEHAQALLTDPQTSGGLLISCTERSSPHIMDLLTRDGHTEAGIIGRVRAGPAGITVV